MRNVFLNILLVSGIFLYQIAFGNVARFEVIVDPTSGKVGETFDLTIKALDENGNVDKNYEGEILIYSDTDENAEFPVEISDNTYTFKKSDAGVVKFENAVKFSKEGTQLINVFDTSNEEVFGEVEVNISGVGTSESGEIDIQSPENGTTLLKSNFKVNGKTKSNHKVKINLNDEKDYETISGDDGFFEVEVDAESGENIIKAFLLDADDKVIGTSEDILVTVEDSKPQFKGIKITPEDEILTESNMKVDVMATPGLEKVSITFNDMISELREVEDGLYTVDTIAPSEPGKYKIDVLLRNDLGSEIKKNGAAVVEVIRRELDAPNLKNDFYTCDDLQKELKIKNIKLVKLKSKSILSWDKIDKATSYNVYKKDSDGEFMLVENVKDNKIVIPISGKELKYEDFAIKAVLKNEECDIESLNFSEITKVQTGPKEILIFLILSFVIGFFLLRRKKA